MSGSAQPPTTTTSRHRRKIRTGRVVSAAMQKTIIVRVDRLVRHPQYSRVMKRATTFKAHDETNRAAVGDWVHIMETRPISKQKRWRLTDIIRRASTAPPVPEAEVIQMGPKRSPTAQAKPQQDAGQPAVHQQGVG